MGIASYVTTLMGMLGRRVKKPLSSYCFLETSEGGDILVGKDGSLATVVRVDGTRQMMGKDELNNLVDYATTRLSSHLGRPGHAIQVWFSRDPDLSAQLLKGMMVTPRTVAQRLKMDLDDLFAERERNLPRWIVQESFYIVLWTRLSILSKQELEKLKLGQKTPPFWPQAVDSQQPFLAARQMTTRHRAFVNAFVGDMNAFGIRMETLEAHEALRAVKASVYPDLTGTPWKPRLPGDVARGRDGKPRADWVRRPENGVNDISHLLWPRVEEQLFDRGAEVINQHLVRIGRYIYAGVDMSVGPQDLLPFSDLLNRMRQDEFPWRISYLLEGDGLPSVKFKALLASICQITNSDNRVVKEAIRGLNLYRQEGGVVPRMRISLSTWAPADQRDLAEERAGRLQKAVEGWGYCQVSPSAGDPLAGAMSSSLGLDVASTATAGYPTLPDAIYMLPWMRDASPFSHGTVLFRTIDGRPWPFRPGSDLQDNSVDIVYAPPGRGKSVWLNTTNLAFCLSPIATASGGSAKLPLIAIIDIGFSSSGLVSLLKEALPPHRRHEAESHRLRMVRDHALNPFDTQLGCRKPMPMEKAFLVNFVTLLGTDPNDKQAPRGLSDLADRAIDEVYERFSDLERKGSPKLYVEGEDREVDEAIHQFGVTLSSESPSWWEVTDKLFAQGARREAGLAQRHAVPLVEDLIQIVNEPVIGDIFRETTIGDGERLIAAFQRVLGSALRAYPILTCPTKFDLGGARVVSLDLDEAAPNAGGGPAEKQTALVYMLARFVLARDWYIHEDNLTEITPDYRNFHRIRITQMRGTPKRLVFDEFHRTSASAAVRAQVLRDMREGRKYDVQVALASQLLRDFDRDMLSMSTGFWIMGVNQEQDIAQAREIFGLSETATQAISQYLNGPGPTGAPFLAVLQMKDGRHEHLLYNTLGPMELWAFSTTPKDVSLRRMCYARLGPAAARYRLAKRFPSGSAKTEIERRMQELSERGVVHTGIGGGDAEEGVVKMLADEIVAMPM